MPLYNAQQIQDQIWEREGIKTEFDFEGFVEFNMAYDEFFKVPIDDESTVSQLKLRIDTYMQTQSM